LQADAACNECNGRDVHAAACNECKRMRHTVLQKWGDETPPSRGTRGYSRASTQGALKGSAPSAC
jgi:hypothetical protein